MRKTLMTLAGAVLLAVGFASGANAAAALVITDVACSVLDGTGTVFVTSDSHAVNANNANGNGKISCKAKGAANPIGKAVRFYGPARNNTNSALLCGIPGPGGGITGDWTNIVSASGRVTLTCHLP